MGKPSILMHIFREKNVIISISYYPQKRRWYLLEPYKYIDNNCCNVAFS